MIVAIKINSDSFELCSETNVFAQKGYQLIMEKQSFFVSEDQFNKKYKYNCFLLDRDIRRLLSLDEAIAINDKLTKTFLQKTQKVKETNLHIVYDEDQKFYIINHSNSDVVFSAQKSKADVTINNCNINVTTVGSSIDITATSSKLQIDASKSTINIESKSSYIDLKGSGLNVTIVGSKNIIANTLDDSSFVFVKGTNNESYAIGQ